MKVGLCWAGSPSHKNDQVRSLPRHALLPLASVEGIEWVSLAKDAWTPEMGAAGLPNGLPDGDWLDTLLAIQDLDLIITVDTAIAHLAGASGLPCWVLLSAVPDMRWMLERTDTAWYHSVRLFRQRIAGDWTPVIAEVVDALGKLQAAKEAA
jgi:hypothetical protein